MTTHNSALQPTKYNYIQTCLQFLYNFEAPTKFKKIQNIETRPIETYDGDTMFVYDTLLLTYIYRIIKTLEYTNPIVHLT